MYVSSIPMVNAFSTNGLGSHTTPKKQNSIFGGHIHYMKKDLPFNRGQQGWKSFQRSLKPNNF